MLKLTAEFDSKRLNDLLKLCAGYEREIFTIFQSTYDDLYPRFIADLRFTPRRRSYPQDYPGGRLEWTSGRQQRWYWKNIGKPHTRTGAMMKALEQYLLRQPQKLEIEVRYNSASTKFVLGDIHGQDQKLMQNFHKITGWQPAAPKLDMQAQAYYDTFLRRYEAWIAFHNR